MADTEENSIGAKGRSKPKNLGIPEEVRKKFVQSGQHFYFRDGSRAFTDTGTRLTTPSENTEVIRTLIGIAQVRGWTAITVRGTERFKSEAWFAAKLVGMEVKGYAATEFQNSKLVTTLAQRSQKPRPTEPAPKSPRVKSTRSNRGRKTEFMVGTLISHGRAPYKNDVNGQMSYFVKLKTPRRERVIWGVDLERAIQESQSKPQFGDEVGLRATARDPVTVNAADDRAKQAHRNRWIIEKKSFLDGRAEAANVVRDPSVDAMQAIKERPELAGTYLKLHVAELVAKKRLGSAEERKEFVQAARLSLAAAIARGEPLPPLRMMNRKHSPPEREPEQPLVR